MVLLVAIALTALISLTAGPALGTALAADAEGTWEIPPDSVNDPPGCALYTLDECATLYAGYYTLEIVDKAGVLTGQYKEGVFVAGSLSGTETEGKITLFASGEGTKMFEDLRFKGTISPDGTKMGGTCPVNEFNGPCLYWTNGGEERRFSWDAVKIGTLAPSTTKVACAPSASKGVANCTATVSQAPAVEPKTPTGSVTFSATAASGSAGSFKEPTCELAASATAGSAECSAAYTEPSSPGGPVKITAAYGGSGEFAASSGSLTRCADGAGLALESIGWVGRHDHGFQLNSEAVLHGCGFTTSTIVNWGNSFADEAVAAGNLNAEGTEIKLPVAWAATTGDVTVTDGGESATLAKQPIDTWRDTNGFNFENFDHGTTARDLSEAFVDPVLDAEGDALPDFFDFLLEWEDPHALCFGFAYLSSVIANGYVNVDDFGSSPTAYGLAKDSVEGAIGVDWLKWFSTAMNPYRYGRLKSGAEMKAALRSSFGPNGYVDPVIVDIAWRGPALPKKSPKEPPTYKKEAHAISVFAVREGYPQPGDFTMYGYNSNYPFAEAENANGPLHDTNQAASAIVVNEATGAWSLPAEGASGGLRKIEIVPIERLEGPLHFEFAPGKAPTTATALSPTTGIEALTDPTSGKPVDLQAEEEPEDISLSSDPTSGAASSASYTGPGLGGVDLIEGPNADWHETLAASTGAVAAQWIGAGGSASLNAGVGHDETEFEAHTGSLAVAPAPGEAPSGQGTIQVYSGGAGGAPLHVLTVSGAIVGGKVKASFSGQTAKVSSAAGGHFEIELSVDGAHLSGQTFDLGTVTLAKGQTLLMAPASWAALAGTRIAARLSGGHARGRTLKLRNRARPPRTALLARSITNGAASAVIHVKLALPALKAGIGSVSLEALARLHGRLLASAKTRLTLGGSREPSETLTLGRRLTKGTKVEILIRTASGGATPSTSTTRGTIAVTH